MGMKYPFKEFNDHAENWEVYIERLEHYFEANDVPADKKRSVFLRVCGAATYSLVRDLLTPVKPST